MVLICCSGSNYKSYFLVWLYLSFYTSFAFTFSTVQHFFSGLSVTTSSLPFFNYRNIPEIIFALRILGCVLFCDIYSVFSRLTDHVETQMKAKQSSSFLSQQCCRSQTFPRRNQALFVTKMIFIGITFSVSKIFDMTVLQKETYVWAFQHY